MPPTSANSRVRQRAPAFLVMPSPRLSTGTASEGSRRKDLLLTGQPLHSRSPPPARAGGGLGRGEVSGRSEDCLQDRAGFAEDKVVGESENPDSAAEQKGGSTAVILPSRLVKVLPTVEL